MTKVRLQGVVFVCAWWALCGCADQSAPGAVLTSAGDGAEDEVSTLDLGSVDGDPSGSPDSPGAGDEPVADPGGDPAIPGGDPTTPVGDPAVPGGEPADPGGDPTDPGGEPTDPGGEPTTPGGEPTTPGGEPTTPGGEPTDPGGEPMDPGGEPTDPGGEPTDPGGEPTDPGGEEPSGPETPGGGDGDHTTGVPDGEWDWGDTGTSVDGDLSVFAGTYVGDVSVLNLGTDLVACEGTVEFTVSDTGEVVLEGVECNTSTGLTLLFDYDLQAVNTPKFTPGVSACLVGTVGVELPSGDVYAGEFGAAGFCKGFVTAVVSQYVPWNLGFTWDVEFQTPGGPSLYRVALVATK